MKKLLFIGLALLTMLFTACNSCSNNKDVDVTDSTIIEYSEVLNVDSIMIADYDYIAGTYPRFSFYEVDIHFDTMISCETATVDAIRTIFQVEDTCLMISHFNNRPTQTIAVNDYWLECCELNPRVPISFDSCMSIIKDMRSDLNTQYVTFRRPLVPPFPEHGWWIFGAGTLMLDSYSGKPVNGFDPSLNTRLGCPLGEWP